MAKFVLIPVSTHCLPLAGRWRKKERETENIISSHDLVADAPLLFYSKWIFESGIACCCMRFNFHEQKMCSEHLQSNATNANRNEIVRNFPCDVSRTYKRKQYTRCLICTIAHHLKASIFNSKLTADARQRDCASILPQSALIDNKYTTTVVDYSCAAYSKYTLFSLLGKYSVASRNDADDDARYSPFILFVMEKSENHFTLNANFWKQIPEKSIWKSR